MSVGTAARFFGNVFLGVWLALFARALGARNVLPANDPRLVNVVAEHHA